MRKRVVLVGAYGIESAGDDAPLLVLVERLRRAYPAVDFEFTVVARHPDPLVQSLTGARFLQNVEYDSREEARGRWFRGLNPGDDTEDLRALERAVRRADLVVAGAGNFLVDLTIDVLRGPVPQFALYAFLADLSATPFLLYGISAGPLTTRYGRELSSWLVRRSAAVTCRDAASRDVLRALAPGEEVELLPDPVLGLAAAGDDEVAALFAEEEIPAETERPRLALALRDAAFAGFEREVLTDALTELARDYELLFVPQCTYAEGDDRVEARRIASAVPGATCWFVERRHSPAALRRVYETADATLAMRLHGAVFSAMSGVAPASIAYLPKVAAFHQQLGLPELVLPVRGLTVEDVVNAVASSRDHDRHDVLARCARLAANVDGYVRRAAALMGLDESDAAAA